VAGAPNKALRGFQRIHLETGASQQVQFDLKPRDLSIVTDAGVPEVPAGEFTVSVGGGQPDTGAPTVAGTFRVKETQILPE
jgi:beta-glucosidase